METSGEDHAELVDKTILVEVVLLLQYDSRRAGGVQVAVCLSMREMGRLNDGVVDKSSQGRCWRLTIPEYAQTRTIMIEAVAGHAISSTLDECSNLLV